MQIAAIDRILIDGWQRELPLVPRPYDDMARRIGTSEGHVLSALAKMSAMGVLSRVGATVRPNTAGASTLAALRAPPEHLDEIAAIVSAEPGVNHNYEREHSINLWFVVTGRDRAAVDGSLGRIGQATGCVVLDLPLVRSYRLDLGFPVEWRMSKGAGGQTGHEQIRRQAPNRHGLCRDVTAFERSILVGLADGLALTPRPFAELARNIALDEEDVIAAIARMIGDGLISRFGLIVRHRELGYRANAMAVWDIEDDDIDRVGGLLANHPGVSLCYRRPRWLPMWPYNLFCMVLGRERDAVLDQIGDLTKAAGAETRPRDVLFSRRCFKQRGANLAAA